MTKFLSKDGKFYMREGKLLHPANILEVPIVATNFIYNGKAQSPTIYGYDENKMTMSGATSGTDLGTYHITFTPKSGYEWSDGTSETKTISWSITKAAGYLSLSASSMTIDTNSTTGSFTMTHVGDGAISATSSAPDIAAVSVSGNTVTVTKNAVGTATITVSMAETASYSGASATCTVRCRSTTGALPVGSSVYMNVGGFKTEFLVVNQGNPDASLYDSSCDGTWLLMRHVYEADFRWAKSSDRESYDESAAHSYLNGTFLGKFDSDIQNTIKQVKIPYGYKHPQTAIHSKEDGLAAKIFLLSAREVNYYGESTTIADGMPLKYFESCPTYAGTEEPRRVAKLLLGDHSYTASDGISWWLRSHNPGADSSGIDVWAVGPKGNSNGGFPTRSSGYGNRPALILPSNVIVNELGFVVANNT